MPAPLIEFPADDPDRARRFWHGVLGIDLTRRPAAAGSGWETGTDNLRLGIHQRGRGPGDSASLPYFTVADLDTTLERVRELGGSVIHPGERWAPRRAAPARRLMSDAPVSGQQAEPTITAVLKDGPLKGRRLETGLVEGRPPKTIDAPADDQTMCRYCLAEWVQTGPSAVYTFLYRV